MALLTKNSVPFSGSLVAIIAIISASGADSPRRPRRSAYVLPAIRHIVSAARCLINILLSCSEHYLLMQFQLTSGRVKFKFIPVRRRRGCRERGAGRRGRHPVSTGPGAGVRHARARVCGARGRYAGQGTAATCHFRACYAPLVLVSSQGFSARSSARHKAHATAIVSTCSLRT
ncbi:hypothetical protein EVAR_61946_1 [Eumeta japonica]|uniref:Uncharacterized protein n=1 Tax=Eumeta variegata TaxID=151549 RepID=A0A4C1ZIM9_EUMVA|nr:hypothetical protein EVAR_61946_1 [Eumeta japonica]